MRQCWLTNLIAATIVATFAIPSLLRAETSPSFVQDPIALQLRDRALTNDGALDIARTLTTRFGPRLAGSINEKNAQLWAVDELRKAGFDKVWTEEFPVDGWTRGSEQAFLVDAADQPLVISALAGSVSTGAKSLVADAMVFPTYKALLAAPVGSLANKIAIVTERIERRENGSSYSEHYLIRYHGASEAAKRGAVAYLLRSLGTGTERLAHTGNMQYLPGSPKIPAAALANPDADHIDRLAAKGKTVRVSLRLESSIVAGQTSRNVIAELTGSEKPDEMVVVAGHIDSLDVGTGALDDAAGIGLVMQATKLIAALPKRPKRTIRLVLFGAEEFDRDTGTRNDPVGATDYAARYGAQAKRHIVIGESDFGADRILGLGFTAKLQATKAALSIEQAVKPLGIARIKAPTTEGGSDFAAMDALGVQSFVLDQDVSRYFDYHHTAGDTFDKIDPVALRQNLAAWVVATYYFAELGTSE
jgi:carboxypeptidase Q